LLYLSAEAEHHVLWVLSVEILQIVANR
jgi:hypothetical protein